MKLNGFFLCLSLCLGMSFFSCDAQEVVVKTPSGEAFLLEISSEDTLSDVIKVAEVFSDYSQCPQKLLVEVDLNDLASCEKISWGRNTKKHGEFRGNPRDYYAALRPEEANDIRFIVT